MPSDDYTSVGGAGALKLKGANSGAKVKKHKKKKDKASGSDLEKALSTGSGVEASSSKAEDEEAGAQSSSAGAQRPIVHKTEAERRFEEAKRKKLLEQAGARPELMKTHKQRVEELNTYLSKLSEHHDMPKIGPG